MMKWLQKIITSQIVAASMLSLCVMPANNMSAQDAYWNGSDNNQCCYNDDDCSSSFWGDNALCWLGGAALGAAAGAGTGAAVAGGKGRSGSTGATGATGPAGSFATDDGNTLTFNFTLGLVLAVLDTTVTPYVSLPDGTVILGPSVTIPLVGTTLSLAPITVSPAVFGSYSVGVQVSGGLVAAGLTLIETVSASRDGTTTTILDAAPVLVLVSGQSQTSAEFTYGAPPVP